MYGGKRLVNSLQKICKYFLKQRI